MIPLLQRDSPRSEDILSDTTSRFFQQVKAVHYNDTPIADMSLYLFEGETWSSRRLHNLTTDSDGIASFSLNTGQFIGNIHLHVSRKKHY